MPRRGDRFSGGNSIHRDNTTRSFLSNLKPGVVAAEGGESHQEFLPQPQQSRKTARPEVVTAKQRRVRRLGGGPQGGQTLASGARVRRRDVNTKPSHSVMWGKHIIPVKTPAP